MGFVDLLLSDTPILDKWGGILDLHKIFNASQRTLTSDTCHGRNAPEPHSMSQLAAAESLVALVHVTGFDGDSPRSVWSLNGKVPKQEKPKSTWLPENTTAWSLGHHTPFAHTVAVDLRGDLDIGILGSDIVYIESILYMSHRFHCMSILDYISLYRCLLLGHG